MSGTHKLLSWLFIAICGAPGRQRTYDLPRCTVFDERAKPEKGLFFDWVHTILTNRESGT